MAFLPSPSRQRLYTNPATYASLFRDLAWGQTGRGPDVALMEQEIREQVDAPFALAVNQCRIGIYLAIKAVVTTDKPNIIMSPFTIFDVVNMVICAGGRPVFADIQPGACTVDPEEVARLIDEQTAAVLITHTHVLCWDVDRIVEICQCRGVRLVEDAAVAFGTHHRGRAVGTLGDIGVYSFGMFKNISAVFGGMVVTHQEALHRRMAGEMAHFKSISAKDLLNRALYGLTIDMATNPLVFRALTFWVFRFGFVHNVEAINRRTRNDPNPVLKQELPEALRQKMSPAQARLIRAQLPRVASDLQARIRIARLYHNGLADLPEVVLPPLSCEGADGFLVFPLQVENREGLLAHLMREGRDCASYYYKNCSDLECFARFRRDCPNARLVSRQILLLPTYPRYGLKEAEKNVAAVRHFFRRT